MPRKFCMDFLEANSIGIKNYCDGKTSTIYPLRKFDVKKSSKQNWKGVRRFLVAMCSGAITPMRHRLSDMHQLARRAWLHQEIYVYLALADTGVEEDKKRSSRHAIQRQWAVDKAVVSVSNDRCCHVRPLCPRDPSQVWKFIIVKMIGAVKSPLKD